LGESEEYEFDTNQYAPSTPLQEKPKKVQKLPHQRHHNGAVDHSNKYRNHSNMAVPTLRIKPPREMNYNFNPNRPMYRCDGPPYPLTPAFYRNMNYNRTHYKNVLRV
ncbi:hypothetical protein NQ317_000267, partial [Molorchus minor]